MATRGRLTKRTTLMFAVRFVIRVIKTLPTVMASAPPEYANNHQRCID